MPDDKVTFSEAANRYGIHFNTLRNWRKAGKLTTAEKITLAGVETWVVALEEVERIARQHRLLPDVISPSNVEATDTPNSPPQAATALTTMPDMPTSLAQPLSDALGLIERQSARIEELAKQVGRLEEEVKQLKQATSRQEAPQQAERTGSTPEVHQESTRKKRWWQR